MKNLSPIGSRVLVELLLREKVINGIELPERSLEKKEAIGIVRAVGNGSRSGKGVWLPCELDNGHRVILPRLVGTNIEIDGKKFAVVDESDILAYFIP
jgi:chaperonin GroES